MHIADFDIGMLGANGIVAGKYSLAPARQAVLEGHRQLLDEMLPRVRQVIVRRRHASFTVTAAARARLLVLSCLAPFATRRAA
jgi:hypothetical protein